MALTWKQKKVIDFCHSNGGKITKKDAMGLIDSHYCNGAKHVGEVLSRMVKSGMLERIKPGQFQIKLPSLQFTKDTIDNQPNLFNQ